MKNKKANFSEEKYSYFPRTFGSQKKAMFFTVIVIFIVTLFFMSYTIYDVVKDRSSINKRVETLNNFVFLIEQDIPRYLYIAGFRSVFLLQEEIVFANNYISDVNSSFQELFYNGALNGEVKDLMNGARFEDMENSFKQFSRKVNANISFYSPVVSVEQQDPWNIYINLKMKMVVEDNGELVKWEKNISADSFVPIEDFEDPLYIVETGQVTNTIIKSPYLVFVSGTDVSNLKSHIENSYYVASDSAPSFLRRLEGNFSADVNGIESFVYLPKLTAQGVSTKTKSCIDYIYFSSSDPTDYSVTGMASWFKIDDESNHVDEYGVEGLVF